MRIKVSYRLSEPVFRTGLRKARAGFRDFPRAATQPIPTSGNEWEMWEMEMRSAAARFSSRYQRRVFTIV